MVVVVAVVVVVGVGVGVAVVLVVVLVSAGTSCTKKTSFQKIIFIMFGLIFTRVSKQTSWISQTGSNCYY